jgi:hypothetical protein
MTTHLRMFCKDKEGIMRSTRRKRSRASNKQALMTKGSAAIWLARGSARRKPLSAGYGLGGSSVSSFPQTPGKGPRRPISTSLSLEHLSLLNITQRTGHSKHSAQRTAHSPQRTAHSTHTQRIAHSAQRTAHSAQRTAHSAQRTLATQVLLWSNCSANPSAGLGSQVSFIHIAKNRWR